MNNDNKALFIFGFIFYFIGDLATDLYCPEQWITGKWIYQGESEALVLQKW